MNTPSSSSAEATAVKSIEKTLADVFATADHLQNVVESVWERSNGNVTPDDLAELQPTINEALIRHPHLSGCGFVAEIDVLDGPRRYWEWWTSNGASASETRPLLLRTSEDDGSGYAYETMAWFSGARQGNRTVIGPYLDFAGADRLVITCAEPAVHRGKFVGVTGADVLVSLLEQIIIGHISRMEGTVVLVNREARVVTSNSPAFVPGERFRPIGSRSVPVDPDRAGWILHTLV